jgi:cation diffusion facilitator family transporter
MPNPPHPADELRSPTAGRRTNWRFAAISTPTISTPSIEGSESAGLIAAGKEKRSAAATSVVAAVFLTGIKLVVGLMTGSLGILAEAAHSALDLVAAAITLLAVSVSDRPADEDHTYGHGKVENFSALVETLLLFITCAWIIYEAFQRLFFHAPEVDANIWAFLTVITSIVVDVNRSRMLYAAARKHQSQALEADALHFATDIYSSCVVLVGLALVWLGQNVLPAYTETLVKADAVAALGVAVIVLFVSYSLGKRTADVLMDRAPSGVPSQVQAAAAGVQGVLRVDHVRVRRSGPGIFVDLTISVDRNLSFERTHRVAEAVEVAVQQVAPKADVVVHTDPQENERESLAERVRAVALRHGMSVHNINIHAARGSMFIDLHLEVDDHLSLRQAHDLARHLEGDLKKDSPETVRVNTHIEARGTGVDTGEDVTNEAASLVTQVQALVGEQLGPGACHDVRVSRQEGGRLVVSLHCSFDEALPIVQVHDDSTRIENRLMEAIPGLKRVLVHAEPRDPTGSE